MNHIWFCDDFDLKDCRFRPMSARDGGRLSFDESSMQLDAASLSVEKGLRPSLVVSETARAKCFNLSAWRVQSPLRCTRVN